MNRQCGLRRSGEWRYGCRSHRYNGIDWQQLETNPRDLVRKRAAGAQRPVDGPHRLQIVLAGRAATGEHRAGLGGARGRSAVTSLNPSAALGWQPARVGQIAVVGRSWQVRTEVRYVR